MDPFLLLEMLFSLSFWKTVHPSVASTSLAAPFKSLLLLHALYCLQMLAFFKTHLLSVFSLYTLFLSDPFYPNGLTFQASANVSQIYLYCFQPLPLLKSSTVY